MRLPFLLSIVYQRVALVQAQFCLDVPIYPRKFAVDNCTACPVLDKTRSDIPMATCTNSSVRTSDRTANRSYACECRQFPVDVVTPTVHYYALNVGDEIRCRPRQEIAPHVITTFGVVAIGFGLYAATHAFYIVVRSEIWSCQRCTTRNTAALMLGLWMVDMIIQRVWWMCSKIVFTIRLGPSYDALGVLLVLFSQLFVAMLVTSVYDTVYHHDDMAGRRYCARCFFYVLASVFTLSALLDVMIKHLRIDMGLATLIIWGLQLGGFAITWLCFAVFGCLAHRTMRQVMLY